MKHIVTGAVACLVLFVTVSAQQAPAAAQGRGQRPAPDPRDMGGGRCAANPYNCADAKNPLPAVSTVWLEEMCATR